MKKVLLIIFLLNIVPGALFACEICGCGIGNFYIGILPEFRKHIFGIRYRYNSMLTHVGVGGNYTYLTTEENYNNIEAWGGWNLGKKFRVMASVPYSFVQRTNEGISKNKNGLGDISLWGYYQLLNNRHTVSGNRLLVQSLWFGTGVKLPTGKYNPADKNETTQNANLFQLGTGSFDFSFGAMYDIRLQDLGVNLNANYKFTTTNKYDYQYGNKFSLNTQVYYKFKINKQLTLSPNAGIQYEDSQNDTDQGFKVTVSGGNLLLGTIGVEAVSGRITFGGNFQAPISQNLANQIVKANNRFMVHVAIAL